MKRNNDYMLREVAGEQLLVPTGEAAKNINGLITMNNVAAFIWEHLEEVENEDEMAQLLLDHYEVDEEIAKRDAYGFIAALKEKNMIID